jgi:hypothetical protein
VANSKQTKDSAEMADEKSFQVEDRESGKFVPRQGWLKEVWDKWPGDESIEELLAALKND